MPETAKVVVQATVAGTVYSNRTDLTGTVLERVTVTVPAAKTGSLTGRTDADTGVATMDAGHGFATSDKLAVFWAGGQRRGMTATVSGNAVTIDGGSGDNLPNTGTALTAMKETTASFTVTGDNVQALIADCPAPGYVTPVDNAGTPAEITSFKLDKNKAEVWAAGGGVTNPLASKVTTVAKFSHGSTSPQTMTLLAVS